MATPGPETVRYGGNTSCVQVETEKGTLLVLDCGTGIRLLGEHLTATCPSPMRGNIFVTHTHWDHIQGFPFFAPAFVPGNEWVVHGPADGNRSLEQALAGQMQYTYFPVDLENIGASLYWWDLAEQEFQLDDVSVRCQYLHHPAVTLGYRLQVGGRTVVYCTDHEPFSPVLWPDDAGSHTIETILHEGDRRHARFLAGADLVIHDAQYTSDEYEAKRNWGHSTVDYVVQIAAASGVRQLALFHHDPKHDDASLDRIQEEARALARAVAGSLEVVVAREGDEIVLREASTVVGGHEDLPFAPAPRPTAQILVIAGDPEFRAFVLGALGREDYVLDVAGEGEEALTKLERRGPDLVLLDAGLPSMDGFQLLERFRIVQRTGGRQPIVVLMGTAETRPTRHSFQVGADDYIAKPFTPSQLRARVTEWLTRSAADATASG